MKRTKSVWTVEKDGITLSMGGQVVATAIAPDGASIEEQRGNAALIAEANKMLAILEKLTSFYTCEDARIARGYECSTRPYYGPSDKDIIAAWEHARAVIAKATKGN